MATTEEFSFPTTNTPPRFIESPPLWYRSSSTSTSTSRQEPPQRKAPKGDDQHNHRKSFSYIERGKKLNEDEEEEEEGDDDQEEERMDVLWEDFMNEEVSKSTCCGSGLEFTDISPGGKPNNIGRVKALKLSKGGGATTAAGFSGKKQSVVVFVKLLKKLFSLQNSQRSIKKRTRVGSCHDQSKSARS